MKKNKLKNNKGSITERNNDIIKSKDTTKMSHI